MNKKYCSLFGHRECYGDIYDKLIEHIVFAIEEKNITDFLIGSQGDFDELCKIALNDVRKCFFSDIKIHLVLAYPRDKDKIDPIEPIFDSIIYYEKVKECYQKFAIVERNKIMVDQSSYIIFNVTHNTGGAYKMLEYAKNKHENFINFYNNENYL